MKRLLSIILAVSFTLLAGCSASPVPTETSATASAPEKYLADRLGSAEGLILGTAEDAAAYGIDMTDFRDDGYIIRRESDGAETLIFGKTEDGLDRGVRYYVNHCPKEGPVHVTYHEGYRVKRLTIAGRDISEYSIYLFEGADECHTIAANDLQKYIALATGVTMPIVNAPAEHNIVLERVGEDDPRSEVLYREGFNISVKDDGELYISGGRDRGCYYGVYEFLEMIGWRFAANGETIGHTPTEEDYYLYEAEHIDLPVGLTDEQVPSFDYRQGRLYAGERVLYYSELPIILRENDRVRGEATYNGYGYARGANHGLLKAFKTGYFDYVVAPDIKAGRAQPCFTDELLIETAIEYYTDEVESRLAMGHRIGEELVQIDIAQVDSMSFCFCPGCMEKVAYDGSDTGPMLYFSNELAKYFGENYPGLYLAILVYWGTSRPPIKTIPEPNLNCSFCFFTEQAFARCSNHCLDGSECTGSAHNGIDITNSIYADWFERWCEIAEMVTVWYYPGSWYYNNISLNLIDKLREDFAYFNKMDIHGVYPCMWLPDCWDSQDALTGFLLDELQWNAEMTEEEYREVFFEYLCILYGHDSAPYIMDYFDWAEGVERDGCFTHLQFSQPQYRVHFNEIADQREYVLGLMETALEKAESAEFEEAIRLFCRPAYLTVLIATHSSMYIDGTAEERAWYEETYYRFKEIALSTGMMVDGDLLTEEDFDIEKNLGWTYKQVLSFGHDPNWWPQPKSVPDPDPDPT